MGTKQTMPVDVKLGNTVGAPWPIWRHLNKLRWASLISVFLMLIFIPLVSTYQQFVAAHAYRNLTGLEKAIYLSMEAVTAPFVDDPENDLDLIKGTTWSGQLFGVQLTDPLALAGQMSAGLEIYWPFVLTALVPIFFTLLFGRFYCGWICPATFLYELNSNLRLWLIKIGLKSADINMGRRWKYVVLGVGLCFSAIFGIALFASFYPPAVIGRELYFSIALQGFGGGTVFIIATLLFDLMVSKRGFCRYLCPGGALYSLLGRYRLVRVKRIVETCNDCEKCNAVCEFALNPMRDDFGQECNSCSACIAVCPQNAMTFTLAFTDVKDQGLGHASRSYRASQNIENQHGIEIDCANISDQLIRVKNLK